MVILDELSEKSIKDAIRNNFEAFCKILPQDKFNYIEEDGAGWVSAFLANPLFNRVMATHCKEEELPLVIDEVTHYYQSNHLPFVWMTWPGVDQPEGLKDTLEARGFGSIGSMTGMAVELNGLLEDATAVEGLEITKVQTEDDFTTFMDVFKVGFEADEEMTQGFQVMNDTIWKQPEYGSHYLANYNGKVVAIASLILCGGVAGIYNVCTIEEARGKGIGRAITHQPLLDAKAKGYHLAILHSSEMGYKVYKKLGFKEYYQVDMYMK